MVYLLSATLIYWCGFGKNKKLAYQISMIFLCLLTAFRHFDLGGTDAIYYKNFFDLCPNLSNVFSYESPYSMGYTLLTAFVKTFTNDYFCFQIIYSIVVCLLLHKVIELCRLSDTEKCIFLFSYLCFRFIWNNWVTLRQNIAILIIWIMFLKAFEEESKKKQILYYVLGVIFAYSFHSSSITILAFLPVFFILKNISVKLKMIFVPILSVVVYFFMNDIFNVLLEFMSKYIDDRYAGYLMEDLGYSNLVNFFFRLFFYLLFCYNYKNISYPCKETALNIFTIMVLVGSINSGLMLRMYEYFAIGLYISMALVLNGFNKKSRKIATYVYWLGMLTILLRFLIIMDSGRYLHYHFWWN